jgi:hypothetical protein
MARAIELALGTNAADAAKAASSLKDQAVVTAAIPADVPEMRSLQLGDLSFRIDTFEAAVTDGKATSGKHQIPGLRTSWYAAKEACEKAGKRLCTEREWVSACQGAVAVDDNKNGEYADDLIEGMIRLMNGEHTGPINIGNPGEFTIRQLAELVRDRINPSLELVTRPLPQDDPLQRQPVIDLARRELGWEPKVSLEQGLEPTIAYFRERLARA